MNISFMVLSSLVVCSLISAVFVGLTMTDIFGGLFDDDGPEPTQAVGEENSELVEQQQTVVANDPNNVEELLFLGNLLVNSGRTQEAIPVYEQAIQIAPDDVDARVSFARALAGANMTSDAMFQFEQALRIDPTNQQAHYYLAEMYMNENPANVQQAIPHYQQAYASDPTTLIGERSKTQLEALGAQAMAASPIATPEGELGVPDVSASPES